MCRQEKQFDKIIFFATNFIERNGILMSELGERIKTLRKQNGFTQLSLMAVLRNQYNMKTDRVMISKWETGFQTPHIDTLKILAEVLGVSVDFLLTGVETINPDYSEDYSIPVKKIRMLGSIACGTPIFCNEEYEYVLATGENAKADFCLTAKGDSMINARIADGDIVFIKQQPTVENGEIAAVVIDDEATLKRVYKTADGLMLVAENPAYQPMYFSGEELTQTYVLGKAIGFQSMNLN